MSGSYDPRLVMLSMAVAVMAAFVALDLAARVTANTGRAARVWLVGGAVSMGLGIWSMHFIGMLAFRLPVPVSYDVWITAASLLIAMIASGLALRLVSRQDLGPRRLGGGGLLMGIGIASMHYIGMAAMQMRPPVRYDPWLFGLSIAVAAVVSWAALWLAFRLRAETLLSGFWRKAGSALVMGGAICGMHYTGMAAAIFPPAAMAIPGGNGIDPSGLAATIGAFALGLLATTLMISLSETRHARVFGTLRDESNRRHQALQHLSAQTAAAAMLVQAHTLEEAAPRVLEAIGATLHWDAGALWLVDPGQNALHCIESWQRDASQAGAFQAHSRTLRFSRGVGLPGRTWDSAEPQWIVDAGIDSNFPPAAQARAVGLHGAFAVPIIGGAGVLGVLEFFSASVRSPEAELLGMMETVGRLLGQFIERQRAETALAREKQFLDTMLDHLAEGIVACDEHGILSVFNRASREFHGLPVEPLPPQQWAEHFDLYQADGCTPLSTEQIPLFRALRGEVVRGAEIVIAPKHLPRRIVLCNGQALKTPDGEQLGAVVALYDITASKEIQQALQESRHGLAEAQRIANIGSWTWRVDSEDLEWSDELFRLYGITPEQWTPTFAGFLERVHPEDRVRVEQIIGAAMASGEPFEYEHRILRPDGEVRSMRARGRVVRDDAGVVRRMLGTGQDITDSKTVEMRLQQMAHFDALTGLPNRRLFHESLQGAISLADAQEMWVFVLFLDLDNFKDVNDNLGHAVGDELLHQVGQRLLGCVRLRDTVARLGGDEFGVVLLSQGDLQVAMKIATKILDALGEPFELKGHTINTSASIGITVYPNDVADLHGLMRYADLAMYEAKQGGRNTYRFYTEEMNVRAREKLEQELALRQALANEEFELYYQPKVCLRTGRWTGVEALLRWHRPGHGLVSPAEFIPMLEDTGLIVPVGAWVVTAACRQLRDWERAGIGPLPIAVNVSAPQVMRRHLRLAQTESAGRESGDQTSGLWAATAACLEQHGVAPELLEFELTESTLMDDAEHSVELLQRLGTMGIRISIDDFGTGYSSLAYLRRFPLHALKIDGAFIRDITTNPEDAAITQAIIGMAHRLKLLVIAECVETAEQLEFLRANGCDQVQGYHLAWPMRVRDLERLWHAEGGVVEAATKAAAKS